jgi:ribosome recycling factor
MSNKTLEFEEKMKKSILVLENDYNNIRAGRANPNILDNISIDYFGVQTPIKQVGNVTVPEARIIQIQPWDTSIIKFIEKAILSSDLGLNPSNDGKLIRIVFPELTEERRKLITKDIKKKGDDAKVIIRNLRRDGIDAMKKLEKSKQITEDELKKLEDELQKLTDKYVLQIDKTVEAKNKDLMSI